MRCLPARVVIGVFFAMAMLCGGAAPRLTAKTAPAPLPEPIMQAKTVYIDNQSRYAVVADRANDELEKWGRLQVVTDPAAADIVLKFSARKVRVGASKRSDTAVIGSARSTQSETTEWTNLDVTLAITLPRSKQVLWEDTASDSRRLIKGLRKRIEEQEKPPAK